MLDTDILSILDFVPVYSVPMIFHVKSKDSFNIPLFLSVCVPSMGGLISYFHFLPSDLPVLLMFPSEIYFMNKQTDFSRF